MNPLHRSRPVSPSIAAALLLLLGCGSSGDNSTLRISKGAAIHDGVVTGFVVDDITERPVRATVLVNGTPTVVRPDGSFEAPVMAGRVRVEVKSDGYLTTFRDVAVGGHALPMPFKVAKRAPKQAVGPTGGRLMFPDVSNGALPGAELVVGSKAFGGDTFASLTYLNHVRIAAIAEMPQFIDQTGVPRRAVALIDLASDMPPSEPVRARVPVPEDATMDSVSGFVITGGRWTTPVVPETVSGGFAEFTVMSDTQIGVAIDTRKADGKRIGYIVSERGGSGKGQGDLLMGGTDVDSGDRGAALVDPQGSRVEIAPGSRAHVEGPAPEVPATASRAPFAGDVAVTAGRARVTVPPPVVDAPKLVKLVIKGNTSVFEVKGTAFTLGTCGTPPNAVDFLEVVEGTVGATAGTATSDVTAGETATICSNCKGDAGEMCLSDEPGGSPYDGGFQTESDAGVSDAAPVMVNDAGEPIDVPLYQDAAQPPAQDAPVGGDDAVIIPPPPPPPPDSATKDLPPPVDMAAPMPDAAPPTPDVVVPPPPPPPPDAAPPTPDVAPPVPDVAYDTQSVGSDARLPQFGISPASHDFGSLLIGNTSPVFTFTVTNAGDLPSDTPGIDVTGEFAIAMNGCTSPVPAGAKCTVDVVFKPQGPGIRSGTFHAITSTGNISSAPVQGTGTMPAPAQFALNALSHDFGWVIQGHSTSETNTNFTFVLTNMGMQDSGVPSISIGGTNSADFGWAILGSANGGCGMLKPGGSCNIFVHFAPVSALADTTGKSASLDISGMPGGTVSATLTGNATVSTNFLEITPAMHDFGGVKAGTAPMTNIFTFTVKNTSAAGGPTIDVGTPMIAGPVHHAVAPNYGFLFQNNCSALRPGITCTIQTNFFPGPTWAPGLYWQNFFVNGTWEQNPNTTGQASFHLEGTVQ